MRITYFLNGKKKTAKSSNSDVTITEKRDGNRTTVKLLANKDITLLKADVSYPCHINYNDLYFLNGYQSWTDTKEYKLRTQLRDIRKSPHIISHMFAMSAYGDSNFYNYSIRKSHGYDVFYSKGKFESFIYNLNYKTAYLIIELIKDRSSIHLISDMQGLVVKEGQEVTVFDYCYYDNYEKGLYAFWDAFPIRNVKKLLGYTSWYNYYQNINADIILRDLEALDGRFDVFQIDDGYETFVGDWLDVDPVKFPNGLKNIIDKVHSKGMKVGLWLAPFVAETKSKLYQEHFDWIRKDKNGKPVKAGGNWSGFYSLDLDNPEVINYIKDCLNHYVEMGVDFFKLDFLYAAALPEYEGRTRCMVQDQAYQLLRDTLRGKIILGCGANIINSYEHFDYLRIGPDVSLEFDDVFYMRLFHRERISTKVTLQNTIYRSFMNNHLFGNDPDVFLLRDENIKLSKEQREALSTLNALFGSLLFTSDDIATYDKEKNKTFDTVLNIFYNAHNRRYITKGHLIHISYELYGQMKYLTYNTKKGVFTNER